MDFSAFTLTGLALPKVLMVLGGFGLAVLLLYLLKLRRRQVEVPFVDLWQSVLAEKQTTRLFSQLKRWLSFLLALAVIALLAFALGDPRRAGAAREGRTQVVLIDASASMQATDVEPTRLDEASKQVSELIDQMGPADRMLIAQMDKSALPLTPLSGEPRVLKDGLEALAPTDIAADLRNALRFAGDVLRGAPEPEIIIVSDGGLRTETALPSYVGPDGEPGEIKLSYLGIGERARNVGITAFAVRRYPLDKSQSEVLVELWNPTEEELPIELTLLGDDEPIDVQRITVQAGERMRRFFRNISGIDQTLEARVTLADGTPDDLPADDAAFARLPPRRRAKVLTVSEGNLYLSAALLLDEYLDVTETTPAEYAAAGPEAFDVIIFDNWVPTEAPPSAAIYIHPEGTEGEWRPLEVLGEVEGPYMDKLSRRHPLLRWTALRDVNISAAMRTRLQRGDKAIAKDASGAALMVVGKRAEQPFLAFTFDVRESDLPLRVAWPVLLLNTVDWFVQEQTDFLSSYRTGETWQIRVPAAAEVATIIDPDGEAREVPVRDGRAAYAGTKAGFYQVRAGEFEETFAVNLGPSTESDIAPALTLTLGEREASEVEEGETGLREELWLYLVLFVLGIVLVEWFTYHRRMTV